jgi:predicted O-linked N-acetylglucosamine transferase (SPINDLY family)
MAETRLTVPEALAQAMASHRAGNLADAERLYRSILQASPEHADALHLLGVIAHQRGRHEEAIRLIDRALAFRPDFAEAHGNRGYILAALNRHQAALASYERALALKPDDVEALSRRGNTLCALNRPQEALASYERALALRPDHAEALNNRGSALRLLGRLDEALASYDQALAVKPNYAEAYCNRAVALHELDRLDEALANFDWALALKPDFAEALCNRGSALLAFHRPQEALASYERALATRPGLPEALSGRGHALLALDRHAEALASYERALAIKPDLGDALSRRGNALIALGRYEAALASQDQALAIKPDNAEAHNNRGMALVMLHRPEEAIASYDRALAIRPDYADAMYNRAAALREMNCWREAVDGYRRLLAIRADHAEARLAACVAELPILYMDEPEIAGRRAAYEQRLRALCDEADATTIDLADAAGSHKPFYLAYQGHNDRDLQSVYGSLLCRTMSARYPAAALPPPPAPDEPVKVGIVSGFFWRHSVWKIPIKGWVSQLDRSQFRIFGYHTRSDQDDETRTAVAACDRFVQGPLSIERWRQAIVSDAPHVLLYPDIGMDAHSTALAAQRLAPVQCMSLGHPDTSGFPTLDYFLSSELMEPPDADEHYTERLVRLPNLSIYYEPLVTEPVLLTRAELGLRPAAVVFWSGQSLFKYLPQFDQVFARIARDAGDCQIAFIEHPSKPVTALFKQRLDRAFAAVGLRAEDHCVVLPRLDASSFAAAIGLCDIVLDSIGWSGFNSTIEGVPHALPIVTMPGRLMRSRHTMAVLRMMGVSETITETIDDYVSVAVRLAHDVPWRTTVKARMAASKDRIYRDRAPVLALQEFLNRVAREQHAGNVRGR